MTTSNATSMNDLIAGLSRERPVLIAGPTASGKSALAMEIATRQGGIIVNADASQVYDCWRILTARPTKTEEAAAPHALYGHKSAHDPYSVGHWLRDVNPLLQGSERPIIVGGTGLYFMALTQGLADIPEIPSSVRSLGDSLTRAEMLEALDDRTRDRIDTANRARVQRAWEVWQATGRSLVAWQDKTGAAALAANKAETVVFDVPRDWLNARIETRFDAMVSAGALAEARSVSPDFDPKLPAHRAIGAPELMAHVRGDVSLETACSRAVISTRQFAKRQRTWFRSKMREWRPFSPV